MPKMPKISRDNKKANLPNRHAGAADCVALDPDWV